MILDNRRITIREVADDVWGMKCASAKIIPKLLNFEQKQPLMDIAQEMFTTLNDNPDLLKNVISGDQPCV